MTVMEIIQIITASTALVAVIVGPLVTIWLAKKQLKGQLIYSRKLNDLSLFRESLNEILTEHAKLVNTINDSKIGAITQQQYLQKFDLHYEKLIFLRDRIAILLDVKTNKKHMELYSEVRKILTTATERKMDNDWEEKTIKLSNKIADLGIDIIASINKSIENQI